MEEARKDYKDALKNMPGASSLIGLTLTESICTTLLPAISVAGVAAAAGAAMSSMGFLNSAGALAKQVSISSTSYARIIRTKVLFGSFFQLRFGFGAKIRTKNARVNVDEIDTRQAK